MGPPPTLRVELIGCGGIGGHLAPNLCQFLHAERRAAHVVVVDGDRYEERNRARMRFAAIENKAIATARGLAADYGDLLSIEPIPEYLTRDNVAGIIGEGDVVLLAVDNHATRHLVDEHCAGLADVTLISGGNDGIEEGRGGTYGNVQIVRRMGGSHRSSSLGRFHPEIRTPGDKPPGDLGCAELAQAAAPQLLFTNLAVAATMLNAFYGILQGGVSYEEVYLDILKNKSQPVVRAG